MIPRVAIALAACATSGCTGLSSFYVEPGDDDSGIADTPDVDTDVDTDTEVEPLHLAVTAVDPPWGTAAGGQQVQIVGTDFDASARVFFGGAEGTVLEVAGGAIRALTPVAEPGVAPVTVETDTRVGTLDGGFTFWEDARGLTGAFGSVDWVRTVGVYGEYVDGWSQASVYFTEPSPLELWELYAPALDQCRAEFVNGDAPAVYHLGVDAMALVPATGPEIALGRDEVVTYAYAAPVEAVPGQAYGLRSPGDAAFPDFDLANFARVPTAFSVTSPLLDAQTVPRLASPSIRLQWNGTGGDFVLVALYRFTGAALRDVVTCALVDDGGHTVDGALWTGWNADDQVTLYVGRAKQGTARLPHNDATIEGYGIAWVVGTALAD